MNTVKPIEELDFPEDIEDDDEIEIELTDSDNPILVQTPLARQRGVEWGGTPREAGIPDIASMLDGFTEEEIRDAINRQVQLAEVPDTEEGEFSEERGEKNGMTPHNKPGSLSIFFYTDKGRNAVRAILWSGRYSVLETARLFNVTQEQFEVYLRALGWSKQLEEKKREEIITEYKKKTREAVAKAQNACTTVAIKMIDVLQTLEGPELLAYTGEFKDVAHVLSSLSPQEASAVAAPAQSQFPINIGVRVSNHRDPQIARRINSK